MAQSYDEAFATDMKAVLGGWQARSHFWDAPPPDLALGNLEENPGNLTSDVNTENS